MPNNIKLVFNDDMCTIAVLFENALIMEETLPDQVSRLRQGTADRKDYNVISSVASMMPMASQLESLFLYKHSKEKGAADGLAEMINAHYDKHVTCGDKICEEIVGFLDGGMDPLSLYAQSWLNVRNTYTPKAGGSEPEHF